MILRTFTGFQSAVLMLIGLWAWALTPCRMVAQQSSTMQPQLQEAATSSLRGTVVDVLGNAVSGARITLKLKGAVSPVESVTDASGSFTFAALRMGVYTVRAEIREMRSSEKSVALADGRAESIGLVLQRPEKRAMTSQTMEFSDKPTFTVAGVTDWTAVGGHGSDATLRTSEDLARETLTLKPESVGTDAVGRGDRQESEADLRDALAAAPLSYSANHDLGEYYLHVAKYREAIPLLQAALKINHAQAADEFDLGLACRGVGDLKQARQHVDAALAQKDTADWHRVAGELDEKLGDPLAAVRQEERAAQLDPSEENYFVWGSELLLHRAVWQAAEVFKDGANLHPASARLLTGWGAALFAGALYDEAAARLCAASDLDPVAYEPYRFMGKIELASPSPLSCVEQRLARFVQEQPGNAMANYLYAMAILKRGTKSDQERVEGLLMRAVALDAKLGEAYLELGIMASARRDYGTAIGYFKKAIEADSKLGEAHYRMGVAYDRTGDKEKAKREFELHDELEKEQADAVEQERRDVKQFLVVLQEQPGSSQNR